MKILVIMTSLISLIQSQNFIHGAGATFPAEIYQVWAFDYFKKHKIEPIIVPWRHRFFWDGGLHCISLDIKRRGSLETYL